jgi:hypothetical protein
MSGWVFEADELYGDYDTGEYSGSGGDPFSGAMTNSRGISRSVNSIIGNARSLGIFSEDLLDPLTKAAAAVQITAGVYQTYKAAQAILASYRAIQAAAMAAESVAAAANPAMWPNLAMAAAAMAGAYATFQFISGEWELPVVDLSSPYDRARAAQSIKEVAING